MPITDANGDAIAPLGGWRILSDSAAKKTINLVAAPRAVRKISIEDTSGDAASNNITINAAVGELIDGQSSLTISTNGQRVVLESTGTGWTVVSTAVASLNTNDNLDLITDTLEVRNAYSLPTVDGTSGQVIKTDGAGNLSWQDDNEGSGNVTMVQTLNSITGATGDVTHDCTNSHVFHHSSISADFVPDFTEITIDNNQTTKTTLVLEQGSTGYRPTAVKVNGTGSALYWEGTAAPTASVNAIDKVEMRIYKKSDAFKTVGTYTKHEVEIAAPSSGSGGGSSDPDANLTEVSWNSASGITIWDMDGDGTNDSIKPTTANDSWYETSASSTFTLSSGYNLEIIMAPRYTGGAGNGDWTHSWIGLRSTTNTIYDAFKFKTTGARLIYNSDGNGDWVQSKLFVSPFASDKSSGDRASWAWESSTASTDNTDANNNFKMVWEDQGNGNHKMKAYQKGTDGNYYELDSSNSGTITTGTVVRIHAGFHGSAQLNYIKAGLVAQ